VGGALPPEQVGPGSGRRPVGRRAFLQLAGASTVGGTPAACSPGSSGTGQRTIRLGYVSPQSGPLVSFGEADAFVLGDVRARLRDGLSLGRRSYPVEILVKDSQSDPERAATVANDLLRREALVFADPAAVAAARRRLDRQTKAEVLRRAAEGQGHPDPEVAAVAVGFARWELNYPRWVQVAIVLGLLLVGVFLDSLSPRPPIPIVTITLLVALAILWRARRGSRAKLERMERANLAVLGGEATATGDG
jgi:hypothetical protein